MRVINHLKPIYNKNSKIIILGTIPSISSRKKNFYYAHPHNRFWPILESLFKVKFNSIQDKIDFLLKHEIALWDTIKECDINASSDASIKNIIPHDIKTIIDESNIMDIFTEGKKAYEIYNKYIKKDTNLDAIYLPSPSAANASYSLQKLIKEYEIILHKLK